MRNVHIVCELVHPEDSSYKLTLFSDGTYIYSDYPEDEESDLWTIRDGDLHFKHRGSRVWSLWPMENSGFDSYERVMDAITTYYMERIILDDGAIRRGT